MYYVLCRFTQCIRKCYVFLRVVFESAEKTYYCIVHKKFMAEILTITGLQTLYLENSKQTYGEKAKSIEEKKFFLV